MGDVTLNHFSCIARQAGAPILLLCMDYTIKRSVIGYVVRTTGDFEHDMVEIHRFYTPLKGKRPNSFGAWS